MEPDVQIFGHRHSSRGDFTLYEEAQVLSWLREIQSANKTINSNSVVGVERTPKSLQRNRQRLRRLGKRLPEEFLANPTIEGWRKIRGHKYLGIDDVIAAIALRKRAKVIAVDSASVRRTTGGFRYAEQVRPRQMRFFDIQKAGKFRRFPKLDKEIQEANVDGDTPEASDKQWAMRDKTLAVVDIVTIALRDKFFARQTLKHKCTVLVMGDAHVPGTAKLLQLAGKRVRIQHSVLKQRPGFHNKAWRDYLKWAKIKGRGRRREYIRLKAQLLRK